MEEPKGQEVVVIGDQPEEKQACVKDKPKKSEDWTEDYETSHPLLKVEG